MIQPSVLICAFGIVTNAVELAHPQPDVRFDLTGTVTFAGYKGSYGYLVIIRHDNGTQTYYGHNSKLLVSAGQKVYKGQQIAKAGSTGRSTGTHCHFEVRINGKAVNPLNYLK